MTLVGVAIALGGVSLYTGETATADPMDSAPQGIQVQHNAYFNRPSLLGTTGLENQAKYLPVTGNANRLPMDGVQLTAYADNHDTGGAIWSNDRSFNLYKDQRLSMWIYVSADITYGTVPGEGMAFVLQNDSNNEFSGAGESLGVWGADPKSTTGGLDTIKGTAIQNSWAVEFDTRLNQTDPSVKWPATLGIANWNLDDNDSDAFDLGDSYGYGNQTGNLGTAQTIKGEHISSGYPAGDNTYSDYTLTGKRLDGHTIFGNSYTTGKYHYYKQNQFGLITSSSTLLSDQNWHHVTMDYKAPTDGGTEGKMSYYFDNVNSATGAPDAVNNQVTTVPIDTTKLNAAATDGKVFWGMTGSTGLSNDASDYPSNGTQNSMVVFEHVPGQANASATAKLINESDDNTEVTSGKSIYGNSQVRLAYTVNYDSGDTDWTDVVSQLHIPKGIEVTSGTIQKPGSTTPTAVDMSGISGKGATGQSLAVDVGTLSATNKTATITLEGKTLNDKAYSVPDTTSNFVGTGTMASATVNKFSIKQQALALDVDKDAINVNQGQDLNATGKVSRADGTVLKNTDVKLYPTLTDDQGTTTSLPTTTLSDTNPANGFTYNLAASTLPAGKYTLKLTAVDGSSNMSNTQSIAIVIGNVDFGNSSGDLNYDATLNGSEEIVSRSDANWSFNINDTVTSGTTWKLYAKATPLSLNSAPETTLDGQLIYNDGTDEYTLSDSTQTLITNHVSDGSNTPVNIADNWDSNSGILLKLNGGAMQGKYNGTVTWTLTNTP